VGLNEQISWLKEEANRAKANPLSIEHDYPTINTDAHTQQLMPLEAGSRGLREAQNRGFVSRVKEAKKELLQTLDAT
jgi:hypothetical protein